MRRGAVAALAVVGLLLAARLFLVPPVSVGGWADSSQQDFLPGIHSDGGETPDSTIRVAASGPGVGVPVPLKIVSGFVKRGVVIDVGPPGSADSVYARLPSVLRESDGTYKMWYSGFDGSRNRILYATSENGVNWTKHGVVIDVVQAPWYFDSVAAQSVIKVGGVYHMWVAAGFYDVPPAGSVQIYDATSADGATWTVHGVALPHGTSGTWDSVSVHFPAVAQDSFGAYWMYFTGWDGANYGIGVARSTAFENFTESSVNPILLPGGTGSFDSVWMSSNSVLPGPPWTMYYSGYDGNTRSVGTATSLDGLTWTKSAANPVLTADAPSTWDSASTDYAAYLQDRSGDHIYYDGGNGTNIRIGLLTEQQSSSTGNVWGPVLVAGILAGGGLGFGLVAVLLLRRRVERPPR